MTTLKSQNVSILTNKSWQSTQNDYPIDIEKSLHDEYNKVGYDFSRYAITNKDFHILKKWKENLQNKNIDTLILIGIGGSALGTKAIYYALEEHTKFKIIFWEVPRTESVRKIAESIEKSKTCLLWISKSGTTLESLTNLSLFREFFSGIEEYYVTAEPEKIKPFVVKEENIFTISKEISGRYSVFSFVGLLPITFLGFDIKQFISTHLDCNSKYHISIPIAQNSAKQMAWEYYNFVKSGFSKVNFWLYYKKLYDFGKWLSQLWLESLGKNPFIPVDFSLSYGPEEQHSSLQFYLESTNRIVHNFMDVDFYGATDLSIEKPIEQKIEDQSIHSILSILMKSNIMTLEQKKRPLSLHVVSEISIETLASLFTFWMHTVSYLAYFFKMNPFNQPGIEILKKNLNSLITKKNPKAAIYEILKEEIFL